MRLQFNYQTLIILIAILCLCHPLSADEYPDRYDDIDTELRFVYRLFHSTIPLPKHLLHYIQKLEKHFVAERDAVQLLKAYRFQLGKNRKKAIEFLATIPKSSVRYSHALLLRIKLAHTTEEKIAAYKSFISYFLQHPKKRSQWINDRLDSILEHYLLLLVDHGWIGAFQDALQYIESLKGKSLAIDMQYLQYFLFCVGNAQERDKHDPAIREALTSISRDLKKYLWDSLQTSPLLAAQIYVEQAHLYLLLDKPDQAIGWLNNAYNFLMNVEKALIHLKVGEKLKMTLSPLVHAYYYLANAYKSKAEKERILSTKLEYLTHAVNCYFLFLNRYKDNEYIANKASFEFYQSYKQLDQLGYTVKGIDKKALSSSLRRAAYHEYAQRNYQQASKFFIALGDLNPNHAETPNFFLRALELLCEAEEYQEAFKFVKERILTKKSHQSYNEGMLWKFTVFLYGQQQKHQTLNNVKLGDTFIELGNTFFEVLFHNYPKSDRSAQGLSLQGESAFFRQHYTKAISYYTKFIQLFPHHSQALSIYYKLGVASYRIKNYEEGIRYFTHYWRYGKKLPLQLSAIRLISRMLYEDLKRLDKSTLHFKAVIQWCGKQKLQKYPEIAALKKENEWFLAWSTWKQLERLKESPDKTSKHKTIIKNIRHDAINALNQYIINYPEDQPEQRQAILLKLALLYGEAGNDNKMQAVFDKLNRQYPQSQATKEALFRLLLLYIEIKDEEKINTLSQALQERLPTYKLAYILLIRDKLIKIEDEVLDPYHVSIKNPSLAIAANNELLRRSQIPRHEDYDYLRKYREALLYTSVLMDLAIQKYQVCINRCNSILNDNPKTAYYYDCLFLLAIAYKKLQNYQKAIDSLNQILAYVDKRKDGDTYYRAKFEVARTLMLVEDEKKQAQARNHFLDIIEFCPSDTKLKQFSVESAYYDLVRLYYLLDNKQDAERYIQEYQKKYPKGIYKLLILRIHREK